MATSHTDSSVPGVPILSTTRPEAFGATPRSYIRLQVRLLAAVESLRVGLCGAVVNADHNYDLNPKATRRSVPTGLESLATNPA